MKSTGVSFSSTGLPPVRAPAAAAPSSIPLLPPPPPSRWESWKWFLLKPVFNFQQNELAGSPTAHTGSPRPEDQIEKSAERPSLRWSVWWLWRGGAWGKAGGFAGGSKKGGLAAGGDEAQVWIWGALEPQVRVGEEKKDGEKGDKWIAGEKTVQLSGETQQGQPLVYFVL